MLKNNLSQSSNLYLQQHAHHPVHWQLWSDNLIPLAQKMNRPIILSIGYSACHWCHVMAHETFENPEIAKLMNENFISVKIDREEYPNLDILYQRALSILGIQGGWPLTIFTTPDGKPFWGGTYFSPYDHYNHPGFIKILTTIYQSWVQQADHIFQTAQALTDIIQKIDQIESGDGSFFANDQIYAMVTKFADYRDLTYGGIGGAPKFPQTQQFELLARYADKTTFNNKNSQSIFQWLDLSIHNICLGGLFDHIGGGFYRYATDNIWLIPHFEKMLYDNALLISFLQDYQPHNPVYQSCISETISWLNSEMRDSAGGFYSSLDADSENIEGKFYLWQQTEIEALLGKDAKSFLDFYHVTPEGNFPESEIQGANILNRLGEMIVPQPNHNLPEKKSPPIFRAETATSFALSRQILAKQRAQRIRPNRDEKILTDWNALMIIALSRASDRYQNKPWLQMACQAFTFICQKMSNNQTGLYHCFADGRAYIEAYLDDYAYMIMAALTLYNSTGENKFLEKALLWANFVKDNFNHQNGAYQFSNEKAGYTISYPITAQDNPTPSGNAILAKGFYRLAMATGNLEWQQLAENIFSTFKEKLTHDFPSMCGLLNAYLSNQNLYSFAIAGNAEEKAQIRNIILTSSLTDFMIAPLYENPEFYHSHEIVTKNPENNAGSLKIVICQKQQCLTPITNLHDFTNFIQTHSAKNKNDSAR